jgi:chromosome segregation ATPase
MSQEKSPQEMILELYDLFSSFKRRIEDPNYIQIENTLEKLVENQNEMKNEIRELKKQLLSPFDGVIVENKKNSEFRESHQEWKEEIEQIIEEHKALVRWKTTVTKIAIAILAASGTLATFILSNYFN